MKAAVATKVSKLLPRLASNHDGEVIATVRAIQRVLQSSGHSLHDIAEVVGVGPVERIVYVEKIVYRDRAPVEPYTPPERDDSIKFDDVIRSACLLLDDCDLSEREEPFVAQMLRMAKRQKTKFSMTVKQAKWWRDILVKYQIA